MEREEDTRRWSKVKLVWRLGEAPPPPPIVDMHAGLRGGSRRPARNATDRLPRDRNKSSPVGWRQMPAESARMKTRARSNIRPDPTEESALDVDRDDQYLRN